MRKKECIGCNTDKVLQEFSKHSQNKDGLASSCKQCQREYRQTYYEKNKEKLDKYGLKYRRDNFERISKQQAAYRKANKEKIASYQKEYYKANKEKIAQYNREYNKQ